MARIKPANVRVLDEDERFVTLFFIKLGRQVKLPKVIFELQEKYGFFNILEGQGSEN